MPSTHTPTFNLQHKRLYKRQDNSIVELCREPLFDKYFPFSPAYIIKNAPWFIYYPENWDEKTKSYQPACAKLTNYALIARLPTTFSTEAPP